MFRLKHFKIFHSLRNRNLFRLIIIGTLYGLNKLTKPDDLTAFTNDMKLIFPNMKRDEYNVEIKNYFQLETLVNSAYRNNIKMRIKKISDTDKDDMLHIPGTKPKISKFRRRKNGEIGIDIDGLNSIEKVWTEDRLAVVEGGIKIKDLNAQLKQHGLMFPIMLFHEQTVMEVINENLMLANWYKNGSVRNHIEDVILMTPSSKLVKTGNRTGDDFWYGYHLKDLIVGSTYSLGFVVEAVLKLKPLEQYGGLVLWEIEDNIDYMKLIQQIIESDNENSLLTSVRIYNSDSYENPINPSNTSKKILALYTFSKTKSKIPKNQALIKSYVKSKHESIDFEYDQYEFINLTKNSLKYSDFIDWYVPISRVNRIMDELPELTSTPYEIHWVDNSALIRIYPGDNDSAWLDRVTSKVLRHKGVLQSKKQLLDKADPHLITRIIGSEAEQIQKEIKRIFDDKDLLEPQSLFDITRPNLIQRIKNIHPVTKYLVEFIF